MQYYTDLKWVRMVNLALRRDTKELESIYDILKVKDAGGSPTSILVEGKLSLEIMTFKPLQTAAAKQQVNRFLTFQQSQEWERQAPWQCWR